MAFKPSRPTGRYIDVQPSQFRAIVRQIKQRYAIRVRRWRRHMSGAAWQVHYSDGRIVNWIEAPHPKTPISLAVFLHEVGHHAIGFDRYPMGCIEEYHAWQWALREMSRLGIEPDHRVLRRYERSMAYAVRKAFRQGPVNLPIALRRFAPAA